MRAGASGGISGWLRRPPVGSAAQNLGPTGFLTQVSQFHGRENQRRPERDRGHLDRHQGHLAVRLLRGALLLHGPELGDGEAAHRRPAECRRWTGRSWTGRIPLAIRTFESTLYTPGVNTWFVNVLSLLQQVQEPRRLRLQQTAASQASCTSAWPNQGHRFVLLAGLVSDLSFVGERERRNGLFPSHPAVQHADTGRPRCRLPDAACSRQQ